MRAALVALMRRLLLGCVVACSACYSGARAAQDVNPAWRGHARVELDARIGIDPVVVARSDGALVARWIWRGHTVSSLPSGHLNLEVTPTSFDLDAALVPGEVRVTENELATALLDPGGHVLAFDSLYLAAGIPDGMNVRTGIVFGLSVGMGRLDDASKMLPSLQTYIGGMLGPRTALVGQYSFVNGAEDGEYVAGHAFALALQYWPAARFNVRAGPAMVIDTDPMPGGAELLPGAVGALSFALVRSGSFVLDLRLDTMLSTASGAAMLGVGVNVN
jgi:hypothetical protein